MQEWKCEFCGRIIPDNIYACPGCGAAKQTGKKVSVKNAVGSENMDVSVQKSEDSKDGQLYGKSVTGIMLEPVSEKICLRSMIS